MINIPIEAGDEVKVVIGKERRVGIVAETRQIMQKPPLCDIFFGTDFVGNPLMLENIPVSEVGLTKFAIIRRGIIGIARALA